MRILTTCLLGTMLMASAHANDFAPVKKTDPLNGVATTCNEVANFDGQINDWSSRFDLVFWPVTDVSWICIDDKNGYAAFSDDFEGPLDAVQKQALTDWLGRNYQVGKTPNSHTEKLAWLENLYAQRKMDSAFWGHFYQLSAYVNEKAGDHVTSLNYVSKTLPLLEAALAQNPQGIERLETLYLLGEYNRRLGNLEKAREYFTQIANVPYQDEDGMIKFNHPLFAELVKDRLSQIK